MIKPFKGAFQISQIFNDIRYRSSYAKFGYLGHNGIDYACPEGTEIIAPHDGVIKENLFDSAYGNYIKIENDDCLSVLAHLKIPSKLKVGTEVKEGDFIGYSGNTGNSTGPHLHWGWASKPRNRDNGFNGYENQLLVMELMDRLDKMRISRNTWRTEAKRVSETIDKVQKDLKETNKKLVTCQGLLATQKCSLSDFSLSEIVKELFSRVGSGVIKGGE